MKFQIRRASAHYEDEFPPIPAARRDELTSVDIRTSRSAEDFDATVGKRYGEKWHDRGTNHRQWRTGGIARDLGTRSAWVIDLDTLDDLMDVYAAQGDLVLLPSNIDQVTPCLVIYDDYIE